MSKDSKIIERIKSLLAMAGDSSSPNEAAIAARRARALMDKHQIDAGDLIQSGGFAETQHGKDYKFMPKWQNFLAVACAEYNDCQVKFGYTGNDRKCLKFQGYETDVAVCLHMYTYLCEAVLRLCKTYMKEQGYTRYNARVGDTFKKAAASTICARLREALAERQEEFKSNGTDLIVIKKQQVGAHFGEAKYSTSRDRGHADSEAEAARRAGRKAGSNVSLSAQVKGANAKTHRLGSK